ncbi:hypothetical protein BDV18DRAFT_139348 [Aspergillus unguis]
MSLARPVLRNLTVFLTDADGRRADDGVHWCPGQVRTGQESERKRLDNLVFVVAGGTEIGEVMVWLTGAVLG